MNSLPRIKVTDIDLTATTSTALITSIDSFTFTHEKLANYVTVEHQETEEYEWLDQIEIKTNCLRAKDLERIAMNWIFKHVEIVKEELDHGQA